MRSVSGTVPLAGSPPTDVGSSAAEAVLHAGIPSDRPTRAHTTGQIGKGGGAIDPSARSGSLAVQRKRSRDKHTFIASIRPDLPAVVRDPLAALDTIASQATAEPPSASAGASASSGITTPTSASKHVQSLGRGFNELNGRTSDSARRSPRPRSRPTSTSAGMHFDPITMSGDGLIMGGGAFSSSSTSLDRGDEQDIGQGDADDSGSDDGEDIEAGKASAKAGSSRLTSYSTLSNNGSSSSLGQRGKEASPAQHLRRHPSVRTKRRWREFLRCLNGAEGNDVGAGASGNVDLTRLRELSWNGIPTELRPIAWPLLLGYLPSQASTRPSVLAKKRAEYTQAVALAFGYDPFEQGQLDGEPLAASEHGEHSNAKAQPKIDPDDPSGGRRTPVSVGSDSSSRRGGPEEKIWHQIAIDVPRTNPALPLWQRKGTQRALERLLYVWALRHDATGYVQGMGDLATPFYEVFLSNYLRSQASSAEEEDATGGVGASDASDLIVDPQQFDPWYLPLSARIALEADTFWCLSSLLDGIQENYVIAQPGIVRQVRRMEELVARIDAPLHAHLKEEGVEYIQFAFRWMNCLLMREMSVKNVVRLWDTYLAEGPDAFSDFHLYVCSVFLCKWSEQLKEMDFQVSLRTRSGMTDPRRLRSIDPLSPRRCPSDIRRLRTQGCIMFLQSLPTQSWSDKDAELLLSEAFV